MIFGKGEFDGCGKPFNVIGFVFQVNTFEIPEKHHRVFAIRKNIATE
jgi:hypothetical protein